MSLESISFARLKADYNVKAQMLSAPIETLFTSAVHLLAYAAQQGLAGRALQLDCPEVISWHRSTQISSS